MNMEFIYEIDNVLPKDVCEQMIERFKNDINKRPSKIGIDGGRIDESVRKSSTLGISGNESWKDIDEIVFKAISKSLKEYGEYIKRYTLTEIYNTLYSDLNDEGYTINEMKVGEFYDWHIDDMVKNGKRRSLSCVLYLNTLEEDQGGCTEFWCGKKVRPKQGKILIFPSSWTYIHRGAPVKNSGVKYTCITWAV
jgi:Rps23 Pro-64 3,4-dihydroxylase Tpa1-like proline 4-hydroxylase